MRKLLQGVAIFLLVFVLIHKINFKTPFSSIFKDYTILQTKIKKKDDIVYIRYKVKGLLPIAGVSQSGIMEIDLKTKCRSPFASIVSQSYYKLNGSFISKDEINDDFLISEPQDRKLIDNICK